MKNAVRCRARGRRVNVVAELTRQLAAVTAAGDVATVRWLRGEATDADHSAICKAEVAAKWLTSAGGEER